MKTHLTKEDLASTYFCADLHLNHPNVILLEKRPFNNVEEMEHYFTLMWNKQIKSTDTVEYLGDFCNDMSFDKLKDVVSQLNGTINVTLGNTDCVDTWLRIKELGLVNEVNTVGKVLSVEDLTFYLTHYPLDIGVRRKNFNIHGHIHSRPSILPNQLNVSIESPLLRYKPLGYMPTFEEILTIAREREGEIEHFFSETYNEHLFNALYTRGL